jgi:hypothetical protein
LATIEIMLANLMYTVLIGGCRLVWRRILIWQRFSDWRLPERRSSSLFRNYLVIIWCRMLCKWCVYIWSMNIRPAYEFVYVLYVFCAFNVCRFRKKVVCTYVLHACPFNLKQHYGLFEVCEQYSF